MSLLPRVASQIRERVAREFDDRGPDVCRAEIIVDLEANNPELLDIAGRCARDVGELERIMTGFCMFYRLLTIAARTPGGVSSGRGVEQHVNLLPRVSVATRAEVVRKIDAMGSQNFTRQAFDELEGNNPELLVMAHNFAENEADYGGVMQGFALIYACLLAEAAKERVLH
jgi:hypothetical protein